MSLRTCTGCLVSKPFSEFYKHPGGKDRLRGVCKPCHNALSDKWNRNNPDKCKQYQAAYLARTVNSRRISRLKINYGLTLEDYEAKAAAQGRVCAICEEPPAPGKVLSVDHNHATGKNRDLLCHGCNASLGLMKENPIRLARAIDYLNRHTS